jgi:glutamyl-tRNA synthetase
MTRNPNIRLRFCPSPTGSLHIGGVRTALFSYLYAKQQGGTFILRIEDTDQARKVEGSEAQIIESLQWLGLTPDEGVMDLETDKGEYGPYTQSQRLDIYKRYAQQLLDSGKAYYSYISPEAFSALKEAAVAAKRPFVYRQSMEPSRPDDADTTPYPIRLKVEPGKLSWSDVVYGTAEVDHAIIDDFVLIKADGFPTYNFANVIDDHLMKISHVVRGPEFLPSTPKFVYVYNVLGWEPPLFVHAPVILGPDGKKKLSKRDGDVDVLEFRAKGYLPEAILNFLAQLGWNDGTTKEIFSREELIQAFSLERIQKSPAKFDTERLTWMNGEYIRNVLSREEYLAAAKVGLKGADYSLDGFDSDFVEQVLLLDRDRIKVFSEIPEIVAFFFVPPRWGSEQLSLLTAKSSGAEVADWLKQAVGVIQDTDGSEQAIEQALRKLSEAQSIHTGKLFYALRIAITGRTAAPGLFETIATLGTEEAVQRLEKAASVLTRA